MAPTYFRREPGIERSNGRAAPHCLMSIAKEIKDIDEASALLEKIAVIVCGASNPN